MKQKNPQKQLAKEMRAKIENKIVFHTSVALISAMLLLFLYNWFVSIYAPQVATLITVLGWVGVAGVAVFLVLYFVKKEKMFLQFLPYCAAVAIFMREIMAGTVTRGILFVLSKIPFLNVAPDATTAARFTLLYIVLAIYLVAAYIYYGIQTKKLK